MTGTVRCRTVSPLRVLGFWEIPQDKEGQVLALGTLYGLLVLFSYGFGVMLTGRLLFFLDINPPQLTQGMRENDGTLSGQVSFLAGTLLAVSEYRPLRRLIGLLCMVGAFAFFSILRARG